MDIKRNKLIGLFESCLNIDRIREDAVQIHHNDRKNSFDGYLKTADFVEKEWRRSGADVERFDLPCDGEFSFGDCVMPRAWDVEAGMLELLDDNGDSQLVLADYQSIPNNLIRWCRPTAPEGEELELVMISDTRDEKAWQSIKVENRLVFTHRPANEAFAKAAKFNVAGIVTDFSTASEVYPDSIQWCNCWTQYQYWGMMLDDPEMLGFSLSPRMGKKLTDILANKHIVQVKAKVKSRLYNGKNAVITAAIRGTEFPDEEIVFYAHAYECQMDDNAVSVAVYLELMRIWQKLIAEGKLDPPKRTIRMVTGWEWLGSEYYAIHHKGKRKWLASICHDAIASRQELTGKAFELHISPFFNTSFADSLFVNLWQQLLPTYCPRLEWQVCNWSGASTDVMWVDPLIGNVSSVWPYMPAGPTWHKSHSKPEDIDWKLAEACSLISALWGWQIANSGVAEAADFSRKAAAFWQQRLRVAYQDFDFRCRDTVAQKENFSMLVQSATVAGCQAIDTRILAPASRKLAEEVRRQQTEYKKSLKEIRNSGEQRLADMVKTLPDWEAERPLDYTCDREERIAANLVPTRCFRSYFWSFKNLPSVEREEAISLASYMDPRILFLMNGKRSLMEIIRLTETEGVSIECRKLLRFCQLVEEYGYLKLTPKKTFSKNDLMKDFRRLGISAGDNLLIHSSLTSLGPLTDGPETFFQAVLDVVGSSGTVVMPAFSYNTIKEFPDQPFDVAHTFCRTGFFCEFFRQREGVIRSLHPSHGVAATGRNSSYITDNTLGFSPYDIRGSFGRLYAMDAKIIMVGSGLSSNSTLHAIEDWAEFPSMGAEAYYYLDKAGERRKITYKRIPLSHRSFYTQKISVYERGLRKKNLLREGDVGLARTFLVGIRELIDWGLQKLQNGHYDFLIDPESDDPQVKTILEKIENWRFPDDIFNRLAIIRKYGLEPEFRRKNEKTII
jgi:aminoglycoside 3-N-acetyltransferase